MESMGKKPRRRRSFTPEFKAEIVELCQRGSALLRGMLPFPYPAR
jgi:transposase